MKSASISELKASLSAYLQAIRSGEQVIITDRGRAFAKIVALDEADTAVPSHLHELQRAGVATIGSGLLDDDFWNLPLPEDETGAALKALLEEREQSR